MGRVTDTLTASPFLYAGIQFGMVSNNDVMYLFKQLLNPPPPDYSRNSSYPRNCTTFTELCALSAFSGVNHVLYVGA
jgi:hypothetical protein